MLRIRVKRRLGTQHHPAAGNRLANYNFGYPPFAYHMKWNGPVNLAHKRRERGELVHENAIKYENDIIGEASEMYSRFNQADYEQCKELLGRLKVGKSHVSSEWVHAEPPPHDPLQYEKRMTPLFADPNVRALLYVLQGVESNIDLASAKIFEYRQVQHQFSQVDYKMPGRHLMSDKQFTKYIYEYADKIIELAEMPPIYITRPTSSEPAYPHENEQDNVLFEKVDGSSLKMTDISSRYTHETRPVVVREGITGKLRKGTEDERRSAIDLYYPSKVRLQKCPLYADVDNPDSLQAMDNLFELHDWPAPLQMMDAAVNYYELDDERYLRLRIRVNDRLIKDKRIDDLYASRHYGQLMLYILESDVSPLLLVDNIFENRSGKTRTYELRALLMILEIINGKSSTEEDIFGRLFDQNEFESSVLADLYPNGKIPIRVEKSLSLTSD